MYQIIITLFHLKNKLLRTPSVRTTRYGLNYVKYAGAAQWNKIPMEIRDSNYISSFKIRLKKHLIAGCVIVIVVILIVIVMIFFLSLLIFLDIPYIS